jgi:hypothetical protein
MVYYNTEDYEHDIMYFNSPNNENHGSFSEISSNSNNDKLFTTSPKVTFYIDIASIALVLFGLYKLGCYFFY